MNLGKSGYLIINAKDKNEKCSLTLNDGLLEYKSFIKYLGVIISDKGSINHDINETFIKKRSELSIKFTNFCAKNETAPLHTNHSTASMC